MSDFGEVSWGNLKSLSVSHCILPWSDQTVECILSGSPLLESLELNNCHGFKKFVIASKSLKRLVLDRLLMHEVSFFKISCPKLEELSLIRMSTMPAEVFVRAIENVVSGSSLLESFELISSNSVEGLVIASDSLKSLVLEEIISAFDIQISCPKLENLKLSRCLNVRTAKLVNLSCSLCDTLDFYSDPELKNRTSVVEEILQQLHHVKELITGSWFIEILSAKEAGCSISPMLNIKCLTLISPDLSKHHFGIARLLRNSPALEELVIDMTLYRQYPADLPKLDDYVRKKFWNSNAIVFDCLNSHLKIIKIIDFPKRGDRCKLVLRLVQFLLKNAKVLEKMVVVLKDPRNAFPKVSQELLSFPRCSQRSVIEFAKL